MKICPQCQMRYPPDAGRHCFVDGAELAEGKDPRIGTTIAGRYLVEEVLGEGGMAIVYRARHKLVDRPCAIKVMNPILARDKVVRERFRREAKSAQSLAHPNIIEIFDQGDTEDGTAYIVMELLDGVSLAGVVEKGPVEMTRAVPVMIQLARGIARAHDLGVIHRDLKPENIFLVRRPDGTDLVKILDFGIARSRSDTRLTNAGELFGTPQYMAPERITSGEAGPSVDLYALGVIFFEMATGTLPFEAHDVTSFFVKHMKETPPAPRSIVRSVPDELEALVLALLAKDPKERPVDAHRVEADLKRLAKKLKIPLPIDAEDDPMSSRPTAATLPNVAVDAWHRRTLVFDEMLARAFGGRAPADLKKLLGDIGRLVLQIGEVRSLALKEQRKLEEVDKRGRDGRQRFGFAVDALGVDLSRAKDELRAAQASVGELHEKSAQMIARFTEAQREAIVWEGRAGFQEPSKHLAAAYRACADIVDAWAETRADEHRAHARASDAERTVSDSEYQIRELRGALANHEKAIEAERGAAEASIIATNARAEGVDKELLSLAAKFCEPLRAKPELGALFQQLESDAA